MANTFVSRKRDRDDGEDDLQQYAPDTKRSTLPFRTSPNTRHIRPPSQSRSRPAPLFTQTATPAESSEEETSPPLQTTNHAYKEHSVILNTSSTIHDDHNLDSDMDMTDSLPLVSPRQWAQGPQTPSPKASPCTMEFQQSEPKQTQINVPGGRLPTPIYGHFQRSIDTKTGMAGNPESRAFRLQQEIDYENYVHRRRLPTPIDEDEAMDNSSAMSGDMMHMHLSGHNRRGGVDYTYHPSQILASDYTLTHSSTSDNFSVSASYTAPPPRKLSFSMGPRANCELCIRRVPGHSNHIIRL